MRTLPAEGEEVVPMDPIVRVAGFRHVPERRTYICEIGPYHAPVEAESAEAAARQHAREWWSWVAPSSADTSVVVEVYGESIDRITVVRPVSLPGLAGEIQIAREGA